MGSSISSTSIRFYASFGTTCDAMLKDVNSNLFLKAFINIHRFVYKIQWLQQMAVRSLMIELSDMLCKIF